MFCNIKCRSKYKQAIGFMKKRWAYIKANYYICSCLLCVISYTYERKQKIKYGKYREGGTVCT